MKVVFAGTPEFAQVALEAIVAAGHTVPLVLTQPDRPSGRGMKLHPSPVLFTSPLANGTTQYSTIAFEADLPRIEADDSQDNPPFCNRTTGANCVNPPRGAAFYPFFTTGVHAGTCTFQQGGNFIPGTINHFGGSSTTEFGKLLAVPYPDVGPSITTLINDFNSGDMPNPCPATP